MQAMPITPAAPTGAASSSSSNTGGTAATGGQFRQHLSNAGKNSSQQKGSTNTSAHPGADQAHEDHTANDKSLPTSNHMVERENRTTADTPSSSGQKNNKEHARPETPSSMETSISQLTSASSTVQPLTEQGAEQQNNSATLISTESTERVEPKIDNGEGQSDLTAEQELIFNLLATVQVPQPEPESTSTLDSSTAITQIQHILNQHESTQVPGATGSPAQNQEPTIAQIQHILSQRESTQVPGATDSPAQEQKPVLTLSSLLKESAQLTSQQQRTDSTELTSTTTSTSTTSTVQAATSPNNAQADLTIENWRAQFSYQQATTSKETSPQPLAPNQIQAASEVQVKEPVQTSVQTSVPPEITQIAAPSHTKKGSGIELAHERRDTNSNFIHSNLPGVVTKSDGEQPANNTGQHNGEKQQGMNQAAILPHQEQLTASDTGQEVPLIFSLSQDTGSSLSTASQQTTASQMLRLPSGSEVPHSQIVNQVVDRFTLNRTLESGSIIMKLHPAELGELRMEIKVKQDNIRAHITTQNPQVQEILDRHLPKLRDALEQQGLHLDHVEVTVSQDKDNNAQNFQEHFSQQQGRRPSRTRNSQVSFSIAPDSLDANTTDQQQSLSVVA